MRQREKLSNPCLQRELDKPYTHDNLYHTALGVMDVKSPSYKPGLDMFAGCKGGSAA